MSEHVHKDSPVIHKEAPPIQASPSLGETTAQGTMEPSGLTPAKILQMQKTHGNRAVQGMIQMMRNGSSVAQLAGGPTGGATIPPPAPPSTPPPPLSAPAPLAPVQAPPSGGASVQGQAPIPRAVAPVVPVTAPVRALTPQEQRVSDLQTDRSTQAATLQLNGLIKLEDQVKANVLNFLKTDKKTKMLRDSLAAEAIRKVKEEIDAKADATPEAKADAKNLAVKNAEGSGATQNALAAHAAVAAQASIVESAKSELLTQATTGYNKVTAKASVALDTQKDKALVEANKMVQSAISSLTEKLSTKVKNDITEKVKINSNFLNSGIDVAGAGTASIEDRHGMEGTLIDQKTVDDVYKEDIIDPIAQAVAYKFGVGRREFRRSKELNKFRQGLKDAARKKANDDIDANTNVDLAGKGEKTKQYYEMVAKTKAHALAKVEVDAEMKAQGVSIAETLVTPDTNKPILKHAGKSAAYLVAKSNAPQADKISAASKAGAKTKAADILIANKDKAVEQARLITKGDSTQAKDQQVPDAAKGAEITGKVTERVKDKVAKKAISEALVAPDIRSGFFKLGKLIDISTPNAGDSSAISVEIKIPIGSTGGYFLFGFGGEAAREQGDDKDKEELTVSSELTFGGGFQTFGFDASLRVGVFIEAKGSNSTSAMDLMSYGLYKKMNEAYPAAAAHFWGQGGKSAASGDAAKKKEAAIKEAKQWAEMMEEENMKDGNYVDLGIMVKLAMEANIGVAKFSGELAYKNLTRYQREAEPEAAPATSGATAPATGTAGGAAPGAGATPLAGATPAPGAAPGSTPAPTPAPQQGPRPIISEKRKVYTAASELELKFGNDTGVFGLEAELVTVNGKKSEVKFEFSGSLPSTNDGEEAGEMTQKAAKISAASIGVIKNASGALRSLLDKDVKEKGARTTGALVDTGTDALFLDSDFDEVGVSLNKQIMDDETVNNTMRHWLKSQDGVKDKAVEQVGKIGLSNALKVALSISYEWGAQGEEAKGFGVELEISQVKSLEVDTGAVKAEVEKTKRLAKIGLGKDKGAELLGEKYGRKAPEPATPAPTAAPVTPAPTPAPTTGTP
ncbi:hypothetical protein EHS13_01900 [Paenibacillus psychroresistens]|uniref:Uncharacterized protein n=1 Tax=Paenibacillus psychroresistens TaxID=1778678 RepID=A0A6B8REF7_9BACL|nr:hypothetical protein [Paenibacillus psychroresistens]QGQ93746.1 hypothetical protein EHS13_01900 [Paenibacillus psychroresistens]